MTVGDADYYAAVLTLRTAPPAHAPTRWRWTFGRDPVLVSTCGQCRKIAGCSCAHRVDSPALMLPTAAHRAGGCQ